MIEEETYHCMICEADFNKDMADSDPAFMMELHKRIHDGEFK